MVGHTFFGNAREHRSSSHSLTDFPGGADGMSFHIGSGVVSMTERPGSLMQSGVRQGGFLIGSGRGRVLAMMKTSTLRLRARPAAVPLSATGCRSPWLSSTLTLT